MAPGPFDDGLHQNFPLTPATAPCCLWVSCPTQEVRMDVISSFAARYERTREEELSLEDYLAECKRNPLAYSTAAERMLRAIGEPQMVEPATIRACRESLPTR